MTPEHEDNVIPYDVINPVLVKDNCNVMLAMPEGSVIGFDGNTIFARNYAHQWRPMLTPRHFLLQWIDDGSIQRKLLSTSSKIEEIKKAYTEGKQKAVTKERRVYESPESVSGDASLLPMGYPGG